MNQKLTELKGKIINSVITVGDFHTSLSIMSRRTRQKIIKLVKDLNDIIIVLILWWVRPWGPALLEQL